MSNFSGEAKPRQTKACVVCRRRKVKCSGIIPCENCLSRGFECIVTDGKKRGPPIGSKKTKVKKAFGENQSSGNDCRPVTLLEEEQRLGNSTNSLERKIYSSSYNLKDLEGNSKEPEWSHAHFREMTFEDEQGGRLSFIDHYFKWVYRLLPFFSKRWLETNFDELPLYLLHAMFAMALVTPFKHGMLEDEKLRALYRKTYGFAKDYALESLSDVNPYAICTLIHLSGSALNIDQTSEVSLLWSMAIDWAFRLGLHLDVSPVWKTATNKEISDINFCRSMWFLMYTYGYEGLLIYDMTIPETPDISDATIKDYISPNGGDATNISENTLSFYERHIHLVTIGRRVRRLLMGNEPASDKQTNDFLESLHKWHADLPIMYQVRNTDYNWLGRTLANLNMLYYHLRLLLLKSKFLAAVEEMVAENTMNQILDVKNPVITECISCASAITAINQAFIISKPTGIEDQSTVHKMLTYHSALYHCCVAAATGDIYKMIPVVSIHIEAIKTINRGPDFEKLQGCFKDPKLAIGYLKKFVNCREY